MDADFLIAPQVVTVNFALEPYLSALSSLFTLTEAEYLSGFSEWTMKTRESLPADVMYMQRMVIECFGGIFWQPMDMNHADFPAFIETLAKTDPFELQKGLVQMWTEKANYHYESLPPGFEVPTPEALLSSADAFVDYLRMMCKDEAPEKLATKEKIWRDSYKLMRDPEKLHAKLVSHLRTMWKVAIEPELERNQPLLLESISAFAKLEYHNMTVYEAIRAVTGRDMRGSKIDHKLKEVSHITFIPSAHVGPYVFNFAHQGTLRLVFGARLPRGVQSNSSALSRNELLTRLNALADDTRLRILELLTQNEEMCAQDIIERLGLSQSSISRHLSQLSATGYISERRRDVAKCYTLNTERVLDTLGALTNFLAKR